MPHDLWSQGLKKKSTEIVSIPLLTSKVNRDVGIVQIAFVFTCILCTNINSSPFCHLLLHCLLQTPEEIDVITWTYRRTLLHPTVPRTRSYTRPIPGGTLTHQHILHTLHHTPCRRIHLYMLCNVKCNGKWYKKYYTCISREEQNRFCYTFYLSTTSTVCFVYSCLGNFSAIRQLSPLPVTRLQI
jgi:hypothetical protein